MSGMAAVSGRTERALSMESAEEVVRRPDGTHPRSVLDEPVAPRAESNLSPGRLRWLLIGSDLLAILIGVAVSQIVKVRVHPAGHIDVRVELALLAFTVPALLVIMSTARLFTARATVSQVEEARRIFMSVAAALGCLVALAFVSGYEELSRFKVGLLFVFVSVALLVSRSFARRIFARLRREGRICRRVVIVGTGVDAIAMLHTIQRQPELGYQVVGFTGDVDQGQRGGLDVLGKVSDTLDITQAMGASGVILSVASLEPDVVNSLTRSLTKQGVHVTLSSSLRDIDLSRARPQALDGRLMIYVEPTHPTRTRLLLKRLFDVVLAATVLLLTAPIIAVAALAIKLESRGPVLFSQERVGRDGRTFRILKLRTMVDGAESMRDELADQNEVDGPLFKMKEDPRVTRVGGLLRKTSIDEIPQLWNVIKGEMSIVGPRPALPEEAEQWSDELRERLTVMPGITGLWQVSGRSDSSFEQYERLDLFYVDNWSLLHDLKIVVRTMFVVVLGRGAH